MNLIAPGTQAAGETLLMIINKLAGKALITSSHPQAGNQTAGTLIVGKVIGLTWTQMTPIGVTIGKLQAGTTTPGTVIGKLQQKVIGKLPLPQVVMRTTNPAPQVGTTTPGIVIGKHPPPQVGMTTPGTMIGKIQVLMMMFGKMTGQPLVQMTGNQAGGATD